MTKEQLFWQQHDIKSGVWQCQISWFKHQKFWMQHFPLLPYALISFAIIQNAFIREKWESVSQWSLRHRQQKEPHPTWSYTMRALQPSSTAGSSFPYQAASLACTHKQRLHTSTLIPPLVSTHKNIIKHLLRPFVRHIVFANMSACHITHPALKWFLCFPLPPLQVWFFQVTPSRWSLYSSQRNQVSKLSSGSLTPILCCCKEPPCRSLWKEWLCVRTKPQTRGSSKR